MAARARVAGRGRTAKVGGRGRSRQLDRERIASAALELARTDGEGALSMRRLAALLGVDPAALYWHFRNKDDLMAEVARAAADAVPLEVPASGSWQERAFAVCSAVRDRLRRHPELGMQAGSPWMTPFNARANGLLVALLAESGLSGAPLLFAAQGLLHQVTAIAHSEVLSATRPAEGVRAFVGTVGEHLPEASRDAWRGLGRHPIADGFDAYFAFAIGVFLDGVGLRAAAGGSREDGESKDPPALDPPATGR